MKQWKKVIFFSIILVVLIAALIFSSYFKGKDATGNDLTPTPVNDPVLSVNEADIARITVENSSGTMVFTPGKGQDESGNETVAWKLLSPEDIPFDSATISANMLNLISIPANTIVSTKGGKLSEYGLDKPSATVTVLMKSGVSKKVYFGTKTVEVASYYVMLAGSERICTTAISSANSALIKPLDVLNKSVLGGITVPQLQEIKFKRSKDKVSLTAISNKNGSADGQTPATWRVTAPVIMDASPDGFYPLLDQLVTVAADSFIELAPKDLSKYGLDKPSYDFTLITNNKTVRCILGGSPGFGQLYGYCDSVDAVFTFGTVAMTSIDKPFVELINNFVFMASIWDVKAIDVNIGAETIHCDVKDDANNPEAGDFKVNGKNANVVDSEDNSYFRTFYQSLIGIFLKGIETDVKPVYNPTYTIKYTLADSEKTVLLGFVKRDELTYYSFMDGVYQGFYISRDDFISMKAGDEGIIPAYNSLKTAMQNQVDGVYK
ncbi:MAG: DUF4340 domain-containing protein [Saccharofermentanales bacterium]